MRTGTPKKFADLRKRNEPKNLRICDLRTKKSLKTTGKNSDFTFEDEKSSILVTLSLEAEIL